jgi:hypothetical protein
MGQPDGRGSRRHWPNVDVGPVDGTFFFAFWCVCHWKALEGHHVLGALLRPPSKLVRPQITGEKKTSYSYGFSPFGPLTVALACAGPHFFLKACKY